MRVRRLPRIWQYHRGRLTAAWFGLPRFERVVYAVVAVWILTMIGLPIARWIWGEGALPAGITVSVIAQSAAVLAILIHSWGLGRTAAVAACLLPAAWLVEYIGSTTGFPFGAYHYTGRLQPQIGGVPTLIPLAWLMMLPPAWAVAYRVTRGGSRAALVVVVALAFTAWDLFLDPQMVSWGLWTWEAPGEFHYFGIPWVNFLGWLLASGVITALVLPLLRLNELSMRPLLIIYAITWIFETIGQLLFWGLPGSALAGFAGMGAMLLWGLKTKANRQDTEDAI